MKKLEGKNISFVGKGNLIKAMALAIPTYIMSSFLITKRINKVYKA